ncbi:MAG: hypothetical protein HQL34_10080 [Alphaproteobacteria bacterium]|nr:hypothetical protein [Alphaproteobacteria bacterium]
MAKETKLDVVRKHVFLDTLPDTIHVPAIGERRDAVTKPLEDATLDEVAFAIIALDAECDEAYGRLSALKRLTTMARKKGAVGADRILDIISTSKDGPTSKEGA